MAVQQINPGDPQLSAQIGQQAVALQGMNQGSGGNMQFEQAKDMQDHTAKLEVKRFKEMQQFEQQITNTIQQNQSSRQNLDARVMGALQTGKLELAQEVNRERRELQRKRGDLENKLTRSQIIGLVTNELKSKDPNTQGSMLWHANEAIKESQQREGRIYQSTMDKTKAAMSRALLLKPDPPEDGLFDTGVQTGSLVKDTLANASLPGLAMSALNPDRFMKNSRADRAAYLGGEPTLDFAGVGAAAGSVWAEGREGGGAIVKQAEGLATAMQAMARAGDNPQLHSEAVGEATTYMRGLKEAGITNVELDAFLDSLTHFTDEYAEKAQLAAKMGEGAAAVEGTQTGGDVERFTLSEADRRDLLEVSLAAEQLRTLGTLAGDETLNVPDNTNKYQDEFGANAVADVMAQIFMSGEAPEALRTYLDQLPSEFIDDIERRIVVAQETAKSKALAMMMDKQVAIGEMPDLEEMDLLQMRGDPAALKAALEESGTSLFELENFQDQADTTLTRTAMEQLAQGYTGLDEELRRHTEDLY